MRAAATAAAATRVWRRSHEHRVVVATANAAARLARRAAATAAATRAAARRLVVAVGVAIRRFARLAAFIFVRRIASSLPIKFLTSQHQKMRTIKISFNTRGVAKLRQCFFSD